MILSIPEIIKGQTVVVTLNKSELFQLQKISLDEWFSQTQNVKSCVFTYKSTTGNQFKVLRFNISSLTPTALFKTTSKIRSNFNLIRIVLEDFDGEKLTIKEHDLPKNLNITIFSQQEPTPTLTYSSSLVFTKGSSVLITPSSTNAASFSISPALPAGLTLNTSTGVISGTPSVVLSASSFTITAHNNTGQSASRVFSLTIKDIAPSALQYSESTLVLTKNTSSVVNTPSSQGGAVVNYSISPELPAGLSLNTSTGVISGTPVDLQLSSSYSVTAENSGGSTSTIITIAVNDIAPSQLSYSTINSTYTKNSQITANFLSYSGGQATSISISPALPAGLEFNAANGIIYGTPTELVSSNHVITVSNSGGSDSVLISITVNDVAPSQLEYSLNSATYTKGIAITTNTPSSSGGAIVSYSVSPALPVGLSLNTTTGVISGTPSVLQTNSSYVITAVNSGGLTTASLSITVNDVAPSQLEYLSNTSIYTKGSLITINAPTYLGGAVVSWSVSPSLPTGLSLNTSTGYISGTPTVLQLASNYTITATNTGGSTSKSISITVNDVAPSALTYTTLTAIYTKGVVITANSPSSSGGAVVNYSVTPALPTGLTLNTSTGVISGTPSVLQSSSNYIITATNSGGSTSTSISIVVNDVAPSNLTYTTLNATYTKGTAIVANSPSSQGGAVVSYSISPALPSGLSLNTSTGVISGTSTVVLASTTYTVTATNSGGSTSKQISILVNDAAPSALSYSTLTASYTQGTAITPNIPSSSGGAVTSYSIAPALPAGLTLNTSTGVISGTPTAASAATTYTVTATNAAGSVTKQLTIGVVANLTKAKFNVNITYDPTYSSVIPDSGYGTSWAIDDVIYTLSETSNWTTGANVPLNGTYSYTLVGGPGDGNFAGLQFGYLNNGTFVHVMAATGTEGLTTTKTGTVTLNTNQPIVIKAYGAWTDGDMNSVAKGSLILTKV